MPSELIDLSHALSPEVQELVPVKIDYVDHRKGANLLGLGIAWHAWAHESLLKKVLRFLLYLLRGRIITRKDFPDGEGLSMEKVRAMSHCGTHIDAPAHYGSGLPSIDQAPLDLFVDRPGVLLDLRHVEESTEISADEVKLALAKTGHELAPGDIVLLHTGADRYWGTEQYYTRGAGVSPSALEYLLSRGVSVVGVDGFDMDLPQHRIAQRYFETKDPAVLWPTHLLGRRRPYYVIENLTNLGRIPVTHGFRVFAAPLKLHRSGAAWARVVAVVLDREPR
jgi:cyclase